MRAKVCDKCGAAGSCVCASLGVGSRLADLIPGWVPRPAGCNCQSWASYLNRLGVAGCEEQFDKIVEHLVSQSGKTFLALVPESTRRKKAESWIRKAIDDERSSA